MLFIQLKWTNQRKSGYESLSNGICKCNRKTMIRLGFGKSVFYISFIFYDRWRFNDKSTYRERKFEDEAINASGSSERL